MAGRKLSVLQILPELEGGGVERGTLEVARALVEHGHRSLVVSAGGRLVEQLRIEGSEHIAWDVGRKHLATLRWIRPLRRLLRDERIDIVHVRSRLPGWILEFALRGMPPDERPVRISTVHGLYSVSRYSAIMTRGERVIAVSNTVRDYIRNNYPQCPPERIEVIPRGVDPAEFPCGYRPTEAWQHAFFEQFPNARERILLTLPGRLTRLKGHHEFIRLIRTLVQEGQPVHGLIVGGEDPRRQAYAQELREAVAQQGLEEHITFTGARSDMREIYAISQIVFSLSCKPESFGRTVVEALSMGVPVIGWDHGGVGEVLGDIYPPGAVPLQDQTALVTRTLELLDRSPLVPAENSYTLDKMLDRTLALYEQLSIEFPGSPTL